MIGQWKGFVRVLLIGLPALAVLLWLASGREVLTKSGKYMEVEVVDEVFGDTITEFQLIPGPIFGYYVGLDCVLGTTAAMVGLGGVSWCLRRRRSRRICA